MALKAKPGEIIRHKATRAPYLVIAKSPQGLMVVNLLLALDPANVQIILHRAYDAFERDKEIIDMSQDEAEALEGRLPFVEDVQKTL